MILAVLNQKGGAGKTVLSTNLAGAFQKSGASLLLIDSDFQGSSILWRALSLEGYPKVVQATTPSAIRIVEFIRGKNLPQNAIVPLPANKIGNTYCIEAQTLQRWQLGQCTVNDLFPWQHACHTSQRKH